MNFRAKRNIITLSNETVEKIELLENLRVRVTSAVPSIYCPPELMMHVLLSKIGTSVPGIVSKCGTDA